MSAPTGSDLAAATVGLVWLAHTPAIDRLDVTKLAVALVAATLAVLLAAAGTRSRGARGGLADRAASPVLGLVGLSLAAASILFGDLVGARVEGWAPWVAAGLLFGLVRRSPVRRVGGVLSAFALVLALLGLAQALGLRWFIGDLAGFRGRPVMGTLGNPDLFGVCLAGVLPFAVARGRRWQMAVAGLVVAAVIASGSRTAWVMLLPSLVLLARRVAWRRAVLVAGTGVALAALIALASPRLELQGRFTDLGAAHGTAAGRLYVWRVDADLLAGAGPFGGGPQAFQRRWPWAQADFLAAHPGQAGFYSDLRHAHADLVELAADYGWLGLLLGVWWVARLLWQGRPARPSAGPPAAAAAKVEDPSPAVPLDESGAARAALAALLLGGLAQPVLFQMPSLALAAVAAGVLAPPARRRVGRLWQLAAALAVALTLYWTGQRVVSEALRNDGLRAELAGQLEQARDCYRRATQADATNPLAQWLLARSLLQTDPAAALRATEAAARELPISPIYALRALAAEAAGQPAMAADAWATAARLQMPHP